MLTGLLVSNSASTTPPNDNGNDNIIVTGWTALPNNRTSRPNTSMSPVTIAIIKPVAISSWISASPAGCRRTPCGSFCSSTTSKNFSRALPSA